jgi:hypothetical protein
MATQESDAGCGTVVGGLMVLALAYILGFSFLGEERQWWHYLIALPLGLLWLWLVYSGGLESILKWVGVSGIGILLLVWLVPRGLCFWLMGAGVGYLALGIFCAGQAKRGTSAPWAFNSLAALALGLVMLVWGGIAYFS